MINQQTTPSSEYVKPRAGGMNQGMKNFWLDASLLLLFHAVFASAYFGKSIHPWLGGGVAMMVFIHLELHWDWIKSIVQRFFKPMPIKVRLKTILNALMFADFMLLGMSGFIVANIYAPNVTRFHNTSMYVFIGLLLLHLALNWKWVYSKAVSVVSGGAGR
ncbi:MAG: DUF4405 domain-containing protein [Chloroflexota bacterium]